MKSHAPFALVNRVANPGVRVLLGSPLHPLASRWLALITVTGRVSGREYTIPTEYRDRGDMIKIPVGWPERKRWWRNLRGEGAPVSLVIRGKRLTGHAVARGDEQSGVVVEVALDERPSKA